MYLTNDKKSIIKEIQNFLYTIYQIENYIPYVSIDGYYGEETRLAILEFQRKNGLIQSGTVEKSTFDLLYREYLKALETKSASMNRATSSNFPLKISDNGIEVLVLNSILLKLGAYYKELDVTYGDFYSKTTEKAVKEMQKHLLEKEDGMVTELFLSKLKDELLNREILNQTK